jgi:hypothetical protein
MLEFVRILVQTLPDTYRNLLPSCEYRYYLFKEQMVLRHHNEAESLNAVQKMDWEWKLAEINAGSKVKVCRFFSL